MLCDAGGARGRGRHGGDERRTLHQCRSTAASFGAEQLRMDASQALSRRQYGLRDSSHAHALALQLAAVGELLRVRHRRVHQHDDEVERVEARRLDVLPPPLVDRRVAALDEAGRRARGPAPTSGAAGRRAPIAIVPTPTRAQIWWSESRGRRRRRRRRRPPTSRRRRCPPPRRRTRGRARGTPPQLAAAGRRAPQASKTDGAGGLGAPPPTETARGAARKSAGTARERAAAAARTPRTVGREQGSCSTARAR